MAAETDGGSGAVTAEQAYVEYEGLRLPPPDMTRHGGKTDEDHVRSAKELVRRAEGLAGMTAGSRVLDVGCGAGRFLIGMLATYGRVERYVGLDVRKPVIEWASEWLTDPRYGSVSFEWINVENTRYNRRGTRAGGSHVLPVESGTFDVAVLFSVFSHMTLEDIETYLHELRRVLASDGSCYCTVFAEEGVPDWEENPPGYLREWSGPLHCVRLNKARFEEMLGDAGFGIDHFIYRHHQARQSTYVVSPA
jgi:SAM-dependent methyltransferase